MRRIYKEEKGVEKEKARSLGREAGKKRGKEGRGIR